jgi:hypothetical protein
MIKSIIHQKINEFLIIALNNGKWQKVINKILNLISCNHTIIHSYLATAETGNIA